MLEKLTNAIRRRRERQSIADKVTTDLKQAREAVQKELERDGLRKALGQLAQAKGQERG